MQGKFLSLLAAACMSSLVCPDYADAKTTPEEQLWTTFSASAGVSDRVVLAFDIQPRARAGEATFSKMNVQASVSYKIDLASNAGAGYVYALLETGDSQEIVENRFWLRYNRDLGNIGRLRLSSRTQLEVRDVEIGKQLGFRLRQRISGRLPLGRKGARSIDGFVYVEPMINLRNTDWGAEKGFDQGRIYAGLIFPFSSNASLDVGYLLQRQREEQGAVELNHIGVVMLSVAI